MQPTNSESNRFGPRHRPGEHATAAEPFAAAVGGVLRNVRTGRQLSLRQVAIRSGGRFKPSSVASYERGERQLSLERMFSLCEVYGVDPESLIAAIARRLGVRDETGARSGASIAER